MADDTKKRKKVKMEEIFEDENLFDAFYSYSHRNLMSETIDLWKAVETLDNLSTQDDRARRFKEIAAEYFLRGCRSPVNLNHDLIDRLRHAHLDLQYGTIAAPPPDLIVDLRKEIWLLMSSSCLPAFLESDVYESFQNGCLFSSKDEFSRYKAEQFFGQRICGSLRREEIIEVVTRGVYGRRRQVFGRILTRKKKEGRLSTHGAAPLKIPVSNLSSHSSSTSSTPPPRGLPPSHALGVERRAGVRTSDFSFLTDFSETETPTDRSEAKGEREEGLGFLDL